jgi:hypothetical protein
MADDKTRAAEAHRRAFAAITLALTVDELADPRALIEELTDTRDEALDVSAALTWHVVGALLRLTGNRDEAVALVQEAALRQEAV